MATLIMTCRTAVVGEGVGVGAAVAVDPCTRDPRMGGGAAPARATCPHHSPTSGAIISHIEGE